MCDGLVRTQEPLERQYQIQTGKGPRVMLMFGQKGTLKGDEYTRKPSIHRSSARSRRPARKPITLADGFSAERCYDPIRRGGRISQDPRHKGITAAIDVGTGSAPVPACCI